MQLKVTQQGHLGTTNATQNLILSRFDLTIIRVSLGYRES